ncbi:Dicer-like protein 2 [Tolypocladium paradoxum]|uniref:Dicer-like protein 2 n=1 Tax=Tolypocladium paradoxum TaxID=94208 RepID=A0A2S4KRX6_9HYPO|nr:Dicer-like protein 2 [Tolypocladium paradoxum]
MPSATSSVNSSGDESDFSDGLGRGSSQAPAPDVREIVSAAAQDASSPNQASTTPAGDDEVEQAAPPSIMSSRAYQLEMLGLSLKQNVIVVVRLQIAQRWLKPPLLMRNPDGHWKWQNSSVTNRDASAVLRMKAELESSTPDKATLSVDCAAILVANRGHKIIWVLSPTVPLCAQHFEVIRLQAASARMKLLTGNDNVKMWSARIWENILDGVRIVVSTHQVLLDALCHAFVSMDRLALIVFDEAHSCFGKHPGSKVMTDFYHRSKGRGGIVPSILGLTATPSIRSKMQNIEALEAMLDAKCVSPTMHREELLKCVKKPQISHIRYTTPLLMNPTRSMRSLQSAYHSLDIRQDPYVLSLLADPTDKNRRALVKAVEKYDTYSQNQIKGLWSRCEEIYQQLGPWAADLYLWKASTTYLKRLGRHDDYFDQWSTEEKRYVAKFLDQVDPHRPSPVPQRGCDISNKVTILLQELLAIEEPVVGIIFVKARVTVMMLTELLASCPRITERYRIGCMTGESNYHGKRRTLYEFLGETDQLALQKFRSGKINLLVATAVLEEGIDVPACNLVVCFDSPETPKAFIQRRGRARMRESKLVLLTERSSNTITQWEALEEELRKVYEDEEREVRKLELLEDSEATSTTYFEVESTGARVDFDNAKGHLEHFCRTLAQGEFVDSRPDYIIHKHWDTSPPRLSATVLLPPFFPEELRRMDGEATWLSEKNATKEVAFRVYVAMYHAGLVSENLLPFRSENIPGVETRTPEVDVEPPFNPWHLVARQWQDHGQNWLYTVSYCDENGGQTDCDVLFPAQLDQLRTIRVFLSYDKNCELRFGSGRPVSEEEAASLPDHTSALLALIFAHRWPVENKHHVVRVVAQGADISRDHIGSARFDPEDDLLKNGQYLVRDISGTPFVYKGVLPTRPPLEQVQHPFFDYELAPKEGPYLVLTRWTKRSDFLHRLLSDPNAGTETTKRYPWVLPQAAVMVDRIPAKYAEFGMMIPSIIHELEVELTAKELATTLLRRVGITDLRLVREAMSARSASEPLDYERLEFLGDSILKYCASAQAAAEHPEWPEGYLSFFRDRLVANSRLCRAALDSGLAKFILTRPFTGQKWRPLYLDDHLQQNQKPGKGRRLSTKTLADVVEALIGASYVDGGIPKAVACISTFLPECKWQDLDQCRSSLFNIARADETLPPVLGPLEELIGYSFRKKALLVEAMTHASYVMDTGRRSYERLEFLGDAVLDNIIVTRLFSAEPRLPHHQMHLRKTAMVNGDFLAFVVMENGLRQSDSVVTEDLEVVKKETSLPIWKFMRHASVGIGLEQNSTLERHQALRDEILAAMEIGTHYPWALLARVRAKKFFSDLFEALLGAVWVDSGSKEACEAILARFDILSYLDRIIRDKVHVQHPKEELGHWAVTQTVTYKIDVRETRDGDKTYLCKVLVGTRVVAEVDDGVSTEEATTKAAQEAVKLLRMEKESSSDGPE